MMTDSSHSSVNINPILSGRYSSYKPLCTEFYPSEKDILVITDSIIKIVEGILTKIEISYSTTVKYDEEIYIIPTVTSLNTLDFLKKISFQNFQEVVTFLQAHQDIVPAMLMGSKIATETFPGKSEFLLEVDRDIDSGIEYLELTIRLPEYPDTVIDTIDSICESYWEDIIDKSTLFFITTDFSAPKVE